MTFYYLRITSGHSIKNWWLIFCLLFAKRYPGAAYLKICVSGNRNTRNNNGDKESPWKIPRPMLISLRFSSSLVNSTHHGFILPAKSLRIFSFILTISKKNLLSTSEAPYHRASYSLSMPLIEFASSFWRLSESCYQ